MNKKIWAVLLIISALLIAVIIISPDNKKEQSEKENIPASSETERTGYFASHGWDVEEVAMKSVKIPLKFSDAYEEYAEIQDRQGLPLRDFAGHDAELYIYSVKNYKPQNQNLFAEMLVCNGIVTASLIYSEDGKSMRLSAI